MPGVVGEWVGMALLGGVLLVWLMLPLVDRSRENRRMAALGTWFSWLALAGMVALTVWGYAAL